MTMPWLVAMYQRLEFESRRKNVSYGLYYEAFISLVITALGGQCETAQGSCKTMSRWERAIEARKTDERTRRRTKRRR